MIEVLPWSAVVKSWWGLSSTPFSDKRNLMRHLMPLSLHSILCAANLNTSANNKLWRSSLVPFVDKLCDLKSNTPPTTYLSVVPFPTLVDSPSEAHRRRAQKRDRAIAEGYPSSSND